MKSREVLKSIFLFLLFFAVIMIGVGFLQNGWGLPDFYKH